MVTSPDDDHVPTDPMDLESARLTPLGSAVNQKRYKGLVEPDPLGSDGIFAEKGPDRRKLDFVKLNYKQAVDKMTKELMDQVGKSELGKEVLKEAKVNYTYVADIAVAKISKNLQLLQKPSNL